jgi:hypothetical protein
MQELAVKMTDMLQAYLLRRDWLQAYSCCCNPAASKLLLSHILADSAPAQAPADDRRVNLLIKQAVCAV